MDRSQGQGDSCRVLLVGQTIISTGLALWQSNYGAGGFAEIDDYAARASSPGSKLTLSTGAGSDTVRLYSVTHPGKLDELVEIVFPAPANSNFRLLETTFAARSDVECVANQDFSAATPVGSDCATIGYYPASGHWFLRNSSSSGTPAPCRALLLDGDNSVNAADYVLWRSSFGSSPFSEASGSLIESAAYSDENERKAGTRISQPITYTFTVTNTSSRSGIR